MLYNLIMEKIVFIVFIVLGFIIYWKLSKPKSKLFHSHHLIQKREIKNIELLPCIRVPLGRRFLFYGRKHLHIHHWVYLGLILLLFIILGGGIFGIFSPIEGFSIGGILQGLAYRDRFKMKE